MQQRLQAVKAYFENNFPPDNVKVNPATTVLNGKNFLLVNYARFKESKEPLYLELMEEFMEAVKQINN